jgi:peptidoglycan/LPS O-acetylase OafA/YrhL
MNTPKYGIITGIVLILLALVGYFGSGMESWTALIPSFAGIPILIGSLIARNPAKLKLGMHIAAVFALLGFLAPLLGRLIPAMAKGEFTFGLTAFSLIAMLLVSGAFLIVCIKSFKDARSARSQS